MKIGIIGAGNLGTGIGKRLARHGHDIVVSFARSDDKLTEAARIIGGGCRTGKPREAATHADVVIIATPWPVTLPTLADIADVLVDKIVWDTTNPLKPDMTGLEIGTTTSAGEQVAAALPGARVVKAIAPFAELLHSANTAVQGMPPGVVACGDDPDARSTVLGLVGDLDAAGVDAGPLQLARYTEPQGMLLVQLAYQQGFGARIATALLHEPS
ncbi:NAD(P)-binding domain-containing protein [Mycobacterium sp. M26]|uniref:NADPH-dependent F420 reductase n=1 Tax=Mycobacterium sp. M26 TaxID=1762962 RepID=UPI00073E4100|nr:NAD(P)-binding domain-containing protein [Mycobacterium sp. M26]